ncbi:hypothetical protein BKA62DRAFT_29652 [Auriculariales sp. MPI-PUGE-AT-0066]|nr:hypothetical protein BKA62DRAFT_29652 [Auriculariales sp. MPI-PUGE-AT-0066]
MDLTDKKHELGGDDLLPGFVGVGSTDGKFYAVPYYTGSRLVFYHKEMFAVAGLSVLKTFDEYVAGRHHTCKEEPGRLGHLNVGQGPVQCHALHLGGRRQDHCREGRKWDAQLSSDESVAGLTTYQKVREQYGRLGGTEWHIYIIESISESLGLNISTTSLSFDSAS